MRSSVVFVSSAFLLIVAPAYGQQSTDNGDGDAADVRIEHEAKLKVPEQQTEELWEWLRERYGDCHWLNRDGHVFLAEFGDEDFTDTYFDTPEFTFLAEQSGVRHRAREVHSGPAMEKDGRQLLQIKLNRGDASGLARSEIKFSAQPVLRGQGKNNDDRHPMLELVEADEREHCIVTLRSLDIDPYVMRRVLVVKQNRRRVYLSDQAGSFATLTLDLCSTDSWLTNLNWAEIELELNEIRFTEADDTERRSMVDIIGFIQRDLQHHFPAIEQDQTPKYNKAFNKIEAATWLPFRTLIRWRMSTDTLITAALACLVVGAGGLWYGGSWLWRRVCRRVVEPAW